MPASRIKAFRVPVVSMLLLLLLLYSPLVVCKTNDVLPSSAAAKADDYPLLSDGQSESLIISPSGKSNSICLEVPGDDFSITATRPKCAERDTVSVSLWFGDDDCRANFEWTQKYFIFFDENKKPNFVEGQKISFSHGKVRFKDGSSFESCSVKKEKVEDGKNVVRFSMKSQSELGCAISVNFPPGYIHYTKPTEPPSTESQSTSTDATHVSSPTLSSAHTEKEYSEGTIVSTVSTSGMPWWGWTLIAVGCLLLLAVVIGLVLYFFVWPRKKKKRQSRKLKEVTAELPTQSEPIVPSKQVEVNEIKQSEGKKSREEVLSPKKAESNSGKKDVSKSNKRRGKENQRKSEEHPGFVVVPIEGEEGQKEKKELPVYKIDPTPGLNYLRDFVPCPKPRSQRELLREKLGPWKPKDSVKE